MMRWLDVVYDYVVRAKMCIVLAATLWGVPFAISDGRPALTLFFASVASVLLAEYLGAVGRLTAEARTMVWLLGTCRLLAVASLAAMFIWEQDLPPLKAGSTSFWVMFATAAATYGGWLWHTHRPWLEAVLVHPDGES